MAAKNVILTLLALTSFAYGQTRALFVTTNGTVQWGTTLRFDGPLDFTTNTQAAATRSNLSLGLPALTNTSNAGLLSALGGLATNGNASALTNFPTSLLTTNGSASGLTDFPSELLRTNGNGGGLTNLPNANLSNATGILPISNGGTGATNQSSARTAFGLGTAATNDAAAFQPANTNLTALATGDGSSLTNVTITDASTLTNFPAELLRTNGSAASLTNFPANLMLTNGNASALTNFPSELLRTNGDGSGLTGVATYPAFSNNAGKVLVVTTNETGVEWLPVSNTVTDASLLTNFPPSLLTTNGNASGLTNFPTLNQNTTGTASNVTGVVAVANGGTGASDLTNARINLLPNYTGNASRVLALNSNATEIVWAVDSGGTANLTNVTNTLGIANGGTGATNAATALTNLGIYQSATIATNASIELGVGATASTTSGRDVAIGFYSTANAGGSVAVGHTARAEGTASVAIGRDAQALANNTIQIGDGTISDVTFNRTNVQFFNWGLVNNTEWGALANSSSQGRYAMTNTAGISGSKTFVAYDGTNYTTNTVTISNGIITGWTP